MTEDLQPEGPGGIRHRRPARDDGEARYLPPANPPRVEDVPRSLPGAPWAGEAHGTASTLSHPVPRPPARSREGLGAALERWDPGITGARALAAVGLIAALASGVFLWAGRPDPRPIPLASTPAESAPETTLQARPVAAPTSDPPQSPLIVHITGDVRTPGVVTLPPGSRVTDALEAAGGLRKNGKVGAVNLARRLTDGEQVVVGSDTPDPAAPVPAVSAPTALPAPGAPIDLNTATLDQLQQLPGVGPVLAQRILDHRAEHGPFRAIDQLQDVTGIGERRFADLKDKVDVSTP